MSNTKDIESLIAEFKQSDSYKNYDFDEEAETELRELLTEFGNDVNPKTDIKRISKFIIKHMITKPLLKKIIEDFRANFELERD